MNIPCPRCGRGTAIEQDIGDFPNRCERCGALLRRPITSEVEEGAGSRVAAGGIRQGALAGWLTRTSRPAPAVVMAAGDAANCERQRTGVLRPESRRELARALARQQALEQARLRGRHQALGALTWAGMILAVLLGIGAAALKAHTWWQHASAGRTDILRMQ